jgi:CBS domain-containing protein
VDHLIRPENPVCRASDTVTAAMVRMTESRLGTVTVVDAEGAVAGIFTDGDLRRKLQEKGRDILGKPLSEIGFTQKPVTIARGALLDEAIKLIKKNEVDSIIVVDDTAPCGVLDIQDLVKLGLLGKEHL